MRKLRICIYFSLLILLTGCFNSKASTEELEDIYRAIETGDSSKVLELVDDKNINQELEGREPITLYAASLGHEELTLSLLESKPDFEKKNHIGNSLLHIAAENNMVKLVEKILAEKVIDINAENEFSLTPLFLALIQNNNEVIKVLIEYGADPNISNNDGYTTLHEAVSKGDDEVINLLIDNGADVNAVTTNDLTTLMTAAQSGNNSVVEILLTQGADINKQDIDGYSALAFATLYNQTETVKLLLSHNPMTDIKVSGGHSLIDLAKMNHNEELVKLFGGG
ncbi:ankyrin repeat domain-containing protein [Cytobacillus sp. FJAT-54145]|uniref:Ankyrin repeat domain-containing protein n=1 Tax=Cytobacillus spartinae TaxID=3299023 RepID=A0ABW6KGP8_9BACI